MSLQNVQATQAAMLEPERIRRATKWRYYHGVKDKRDPTLIKVLRKEVTLLFQLDYH